VDFNIKVVKGRAEKGELQKRLHGRALNPAVLGIRILRIGMFFGPSGSVSQGYGSGSFPFLTKSVERTEIMQNFSLKQ
jgi:hypothetical protein